VNGTLAHSRTGAVPDVRYVNPAILGPVQNCPAFVVVNHFIIRVYQNPVLVQDCIVPTDLMFVKVALSVKVAVVKALAFTWVIYPSAPCVLS